MLAARNRLGVFPPAFVVVRDKGRVEMHGLEFPDAVFLHVAILVDAFAPCAALLVDPRHRQLAAARPCGVAIRRHIDNDLKLQAIVELPLHPAFGAHQTEELADAAVPA